MKSIKNWTKANKVVAVCATAAVVCALAGGGWAGALPGCRAQRHREPPGCEHRFHQRWQLCCDPGTGA